MSMRFAKIPLFVLTFVLLSVGLNIQKAKAQVQWIPAANGEVPSGAVPGGIEKGRQLYICKAQYKGGYHPGKIVGNYCNISWGGKEIPVPSYQVLVVIDNFDNSSWHPVWQHASNGEVPSGAVTGGIEKGRQLYICKAQYRDGYHPGKIVDNFCHISWGGKEITVPSYQVLTFQSQPHTQSAFDLLKQSQQKLQRQDYRGAISDLNQAMLLEPNDANIYFNRGIILHILGDQLGAIEDFDATLLRNPHHALAYLHRGGLRLVREDQPGAMLDLQIAAKLFLSQGDKSKYQKVQKLIQKIQQ